MSFKKMSAKAKALGIAVVASATSAMASSSSVTVPTPDYTTFYAVVGVGLAVTLIVSLARKAKGFLK